MSQLPGTEVLDGPETCDGASERRQHEQACGRDTLVSAFRAVGVGRHTVRVARDRFNAIVAQARNGTPQLIGAKPKTMTVVMSLTDLVEIVRVAAKRQPFGEALDAAGFRPAAGKKMAVRPGFPQEPLVWRRFKKPGNE